MKRSRLVFLVGSMIFGFIFQSVAQEVIVLPEIEIVAVNYKYLNTVGEEVSVPVRTLEDKVANFDLKNAEFYTDEYDTYMVSFYIPDGRILASYDKEGNLLRTAEKFKDVNLPMAVKQSVAKRFPMWTITKDVYRVNYHDSKGVTKRYKLILQNGDERLKVKVDEKGVFL